MMAVPCCWSSQRCLNFEPGSAIVRERRSLTERCCAPITENSSGKSTFPLLRAQIHSCFTLLQVPQLCMHVLFYWRCLYQHAQIEGA